VVNVREGFSVPLGLRGVIIRIQKGEKVEDNLYDVLFDEMFTGGLSLRCSSGRGYRLPGSALINITFKEGGKRSDQGSSGGKMKPRAVVRPYDRREESEGHAGGKRENVWNNRSKNTPTAYGQAQPRREEGQQAFPPLAHNSPRQGSINRGSEGSRGSTKGGNRSGGGRDLRLEQENVRIIQREQEKGNGNFDDIWQSLQAGGQQGKSCGAAGPITGGPDQGVGGPIMKSGGSVTDMETSLKALLNISGASQDPPPRSSVAPLTPLAISQAQSHCRTLMTQLASSGRSLPRYDYISDPTTGLVAAQVSLDDGTMFHSPVPCNDREEASEGAARVALEGMGLLPTKRGSGVKGRGGRAGRGRGRGSGEHENKYQPWAHYSGGYEQEERNQFPAQHRTKKQEKSSIDARAGTDQMDIRYRDKEGDYKKQASLKPAFVPLQVSRKAAKSKEKEIEEEELVMPKLEEVKVQVVKPGKTEGGKGVAAKEGTPPRVQGRGASRRKPRIAANFGGVQQ